MNVAKVSITSYILVNYFLHIFVYVVIYMLQDNFYTGKNREMFTKNLENPPKRKKSGISFGIFLPILKNMFILSLDVLVMAVVIAPLKTPSDEHLAQVKAIQLKLAPYTKSRELMMMNKEKLVKA